MMWIRIIMVLVFAGFLAFINFNYVQPYGLFGEGGDYCKVLSAEGYFEGKYDTANHINCTIGYEEGRNDSKNWWSCPYNTNCFSFDSYDDECELNIDMKDYGMRCVWGGLGWMVTALTMILWIMVVMIILITIGSLWYDEDNEKDKIKLVGVKDETH